MELINRFVGIDSDTYNVIAERRLGNINCSDDMHYRMAEITPLPGTKHNEIHELAVGQICEPIIIVVGNRGLFAIEYDSQPGEVHIIHTSEVKKVTVDKKMNEYIITTSHTIYRMVRR